MGRNSGTNVSSFAVRLSGPKGFSSGQLRRAKLKAVGHTGGNDSGEKLVDVNAEQMHAIYRMYTTDETIAACRTVLQRFLFREEVQILWGSARKPLRKEYVEKLRKFFTEALDHFLMFGFVVWTESVDECNNRIPLVLPMGTYRLKRRQHEDFSVSYEIESDTGAKQVDLGLVHIEVVNGYEPTSDGRVVSKMSTLLYCNDTVHTLFDLKMITESRRAAPPVVVEHQRAAGGGGGGGGGRLTNEPIGIAYFDVHAANHQKAVQHTKEQLNFLEAAIQRTYDRNRHSAREAGRNRSFASSTPGEDAILAAFGMKGSGDSGGVIPIPEGMTTANYQLPQPATDLVALEQMRLDKVCAAMGVPRSLLSSGGGGGSGGGRMLQSTQTGQMCLMNITLGEMKDIVKLISESVLMKMFDERDRKELKMRYVKLELESKDEKTKKKEGGEEEEEEEKRRSKEMKQIALNRDCEKMYTIEFGMTSSLSIGDYEKLHMLNVLKPEAEARILSSLFGIDENMVDQAHIRREREANLALLSNQARAVTQDVQIKKDEQKVKDRESRTKEKTMKIAAEAAKKAAENGGGDGDDMSATGGGGVKRKTVMESDGKEKEKGKKADKKGESVASRTKKRTRTSSSSKK